MIGEAVRQAFDRKLHDLCDEVLLLGSMVEKGLSDAVQALVRRDLDAAGALLVQSGEIGRQRDAIESDTLALMVTQQPVASDLRTLAAALEIAAELARIGGYCDEINRLNLMLGLESGPRPAGEIVRMTNTVRGMLRQALDAFVRRDLALAERTPADDDRVDALYQKMSQSLLAPAAGEMQWEGRLHLLRVAHHLERAADRAVNICEWVVYAITGQLCELG